MSCIALIHGRIFAIRWRRHLTRMRQTKTFKQNVKKHFIVLLSGSWPRAVLPCACRACQSGRPPADNNRSTNLADFVRRRHSDESSRNRRTLPPAADNTCVVQQSKLRDRDPIRRRPAFAAAARCLMCQAAPAAANGTANGSSRAERPGSAAIKQEQRPVAAALPATSAAHWPHSPSVPPCTIDDDDAP